MVRMMLAAALLTVSGAALAQADKPADGKAAGKQDRRVCRPVVETGSRLARADECHLASEWAVIDAQRADNARKLMNGVSGGAAALNAPITNRPY